MMMMRVGRTNVGRPLFYCLLAQKTVNVYRTYKTLTMTESRRRRR